MPVLEGVDVSHHNGKIDWPAVKAAGVSFAFIKATEGPHWIDPKCQSNVAGCRAEGIVIGMYHFYRHDADPEEQAASFLKTVGARQPGDLPFALDVEGDGDGAGTITYPKTEVVHRIALFVQAIERATASVPLIYTYPSVWQEITGNSNAFADTCPLWIASYGSAPTIPGSWKSYAVWQYTDRGHVTGISTIVDRDRLSESAPDIEPLVLRSLEVGAAAIITDDANIREAPGLGASVIKVIGRGTTVRVVDGPEMVKDRHWWKIDDGHDTAGWCSEKLLRPA